MLEFLGEEASAAAIVRAVHASTARPETRTRDLGGTAGTREAGEAIRAELRAAVEVG